MQYCCQFHYASAYYYFQDIFKLGLKENINLFIFSIFFGLLVFLLTGQYSSLTRYVGSSSFYKLGIKKYLLSYIVDYYWENI